MMGLMSKPYHWRLALMPVLHQARIGLSCGLVQKGTGGRNEKLATSRAALSSMHLRDRRQGVFGGGDELLEDLQRYVELVQGNGEFLGGIPKKDLGDMPVVMVQLQTHAFAL